MTALAVAGLAGRPPAGPWAVAPPGGAFLAALRRSASFLRVADRADLLLDQVAEAVDLRRLSGSVEPIACPLWPPLLRAAHGLVPGIDVTNLLGLAEPPELRLDAPGALHPEYRIFFHGAAAWREYRRRLEAAAGTPAVEVAGVLLVDAQRRLMLELRAPGKLLYPLHWDSPGGKLAAGESPAQAGARELAEEYGVCLRLERLRRLAAILDREPTTGVAVRHHIFAASGGELPVRASSEALGADWFTRAAAAELPGVPRPLRLVLRDPEVALMP